MLRWLPWLLAFALLAALAAWWYVAMRPLTLAAPRVEFVVPAGASARTIATQAQAAGVGLTEPVFVWLARLTDATKSLHAGRYAVEQGATLATLLDKLRNGEVLPSKFTLVEGTNLRELRAKLAEEADLRQDSATMDEKQLLAAIGATEPHAEGLFAPDTYVFAPGSSDLDIYRQAYRAQRKILAEAWNKRASGLPLHSPYEALILASIVEKETGRAEDRPLVASVFINRLKIRMPLQTDPTVIYGLGKSFDGNLRKKHLVTDTPYNTYTRGGLPPSPISAPGRAAIAATLNPPPSSKLYFVARGDGSSQFSSSLADHNRAVDKFQRGR
ncbi:MAG: endolytic transglycosylase MltG [Burkholderiaceae bacterium]